MWTRLDMIRREGRAGDEEAERDAGTNGVCTVAQHEKGGKGVHGSAAHERGMQTKRGTSIGCSVVVFCK